MSAVCSSSYSLAEGFTAVLVRLWSLAFPCTASACGVAYLLPVCVCACVRAHVRVHVCRRQFGLIYGPLTHSTFWTPPLLMKWLSHVLLVVDPPGWFSADGGQMWHPLLSSSRGAAVHRRRLSEKHALRLAGSTVVAQKKFWSISLVFLWKPPPGKPGDWRWPWHLWPIQALFLSVFMCNPVWGDSLLYFSTCCNKISPKHFGQVLCSAPSQWALCWKWWL